MIWDLLAHALKYAGHGAPVLPLWWTEDVVCACSEGSSCSSAGKHPLTRHGLKEATTDEATITGWWTKWPRANIGVCTGYVCDVLDVDHPDIREGTSDLPPGMLPWDCSVIETPHGWHVLFKATGGGNKTKFSKYCDWRGVGGYVVAPPSIVGGQTYETYYHGFPTFADAPASLTALLQRKNHTPNAHGRAFDPDLIPDVGEATRRRTWSAKGLVRSVESAVVGERNSLLNWAAHCVGLAVFDRSANDRSEVDGVLCELLAAALRAGLPESEAVKTIGRAFRDGAEGKSPERVSDL